jgi:hypothetical protein
MRSPGIVLLIVAALIAQSRSTLARSAEVTPAQAPPSASSGRDGCHPNVGANAPRLGENSSGKTLSDRLAQSSGVICPPSGVDPQMTSPPPAGGNTPVIPPPGTPGGDRSLQPK